MRLAAVNEVVPVLTPAPQPAQESVPLNSLADIVALADKKRDMQAKVLLRTCVRFGSIRPGVLEIGLTEDAPKTFAADLSRKLTGWTGTRWSVAISPNAKAQTLAEAENAKRDGMVADAKADPDVAAILARFPGSKIINVRIETAAEADDMPMEGASAASEMMPVEPVNEDDD